MNGEKTNDDGAESEIRPAGRYPLAESRFYRCGMRHSTAAGSMRGSGRLLITGTGSGCGKTTMTLAILQALVNRGEDVAAFKCGPDYIDPLFQREIIGTDSGNIDLFLAGPKARGLFLRHGKAVNIIEGAMGYYDGLSMDSVEASSWAVAQELEAPVLLTVNARGMALSSAALVQGFQNFRSPSRIAGVLLNQIAPSTYARLKAVLEAECGVPVYGYLPVMPECALESRHLGLVTAGEVAGLREKLQRLAAQAEQSIALDDLIALTQGQPELTGVIPKASKIGQVRIAVAMDAAFCFYYRDNLLLLQDLGAELIPFSPLTDAQLPDCDGLYMGGGYPELYREKLADNTSMRSSICGAVKSGLPTVAECGGFMYLLESIGGFPMASVLPGSCHDTGHLVRFGYVTLTGETDSLLLGPGEQIRGHEFHHWEADVPGDMLAAVKPSGLSWRCAHVSDTLYAGYPHLYFPSNPKAAERLVRKCLERKMCHETNGH